MESGYDQLNPWGPDYEYWLELVTRLAPRSIVDLGCGTGQLTVLFARALPDAQVVGVDPDPQMLDVAQVRDGHELVRWVEGYADAIPSDSADLITMTSHVSQVFTNDQDWAAALEEIARALRSDGRIAFDMRNLLARGWEAWNQQDTLKTIQTDSGPAEVWHEVTAVRGGVVTYDTITRWIDTGTAETNSDTLRFLDEAGLRDSLQRAGFLVKQLHGSWDGKDATPSSSELIVTAIRANPDSHEQD